MSGRSGTTRATCRPAYLVRGDTGSLVAQTVRTLIDELIGDRDPALVLEEHGGTSDDLDVGAVVDACSTPPFLVDRRVVVVRDAGRIVSADAARLVAVLTNPIPTNVLVLAGGGGTIPQSLVKAVTAAGEVIDLAVRFQKDRTRWLDEHIKSASVRLQADAARQLGVHIGEDLGRLEGVLSTLESAYGTGASIGAAELAPFLGDAGGVPPWDLTDAIDGGDMAAALAALRRMLGAGGRVPVEIISSLHRHFSGMLRLDGSGARDGQEAASILGVSSTFVGKKALAQANRLGGDRVGQAVVLVADADLDVKGRSALPAEMVLEVLVARLSRLSRTRPGARRR